MRNLALIDKKPASCSFLKGCCAATVERNCMYFANQNELCKLDVDQKNAEDNVSLSKSQFIMNFQHTNSFSISLGGNIRAFRCWNCSGFEVLTRRGCACDSG